MYSLILIAAISTGGLIPEGRFIGEVVGEESRRELPLGAVVELLMRAVVYLPAPESTVVAGEYTLLVDGQVDIPWRRFTDARVIRGDLVIFSDPYTFDAHVGSDGWQAMVWRGSVIAYTPEFVDYPTGDSNLSGTFDTADLLQIFQAGEYEDGVAQNSSWSTGDWNADGEFDTSDLVVANQAGSYVAAASAVPEPTAVVLLLIGLLAIARRSLSAAYAGRSCLRWW